MRSQEGAQGLAPYKPTGIWSSWKGCGLVSGSQRFIRQQKPCPEQSLPAANTTKGALLMLVLLVTGELSFKTAEACPLFYAVFATIGLGNKHIMDIVLSEANATNPEKAAFEKVQECYNEGGLKAKTLDTIALSILTFSPECLKSAAKELEEDIKKVVSKLNPLSR
ncbi:LOW QUALITY PROTEIN: androgen-binding protein homolog [Otolemur garnettii]|uniref:LOW QUALITY PROTEIN: androgen-binding protein homolog n=1 Tax=Otolemur garnettii TaxID=30611 RepID=UPI000C7EAAD1|nr:LOW QUALITY PROTEIN: androgen-binding protein homolog [Otolemur garnettii]